MSSSFSVKFIARSKLNSAKCCEALLAYACENNELSMSCGDKGIHVITANYGRLGGEICPENIGVKNFECIYTETSNVVKQR